VSLAAQRLIAGVVSDAFQMHRRTVDLRQKPVKDQPVKEEEYILTAEDLADALQEVRLCCATDWLWSSFPQSDFFRVSAFSYEECLHLFFLLATALPVKKIFSGCKRVPFAEFLPAGPCLLTLF
jgi:hypothetical protein